jgi:hypothetical protein
MTLTLATEVAEMPKKNLVSVKIDAEVYRLAKTAAAWKGKDLSDYMSDILRPVAKRDCAKIGQAASSDEGDER